MPVSITDAAAALGFRSRSTLYRLLDQGLLKDWEREGPRGQRWLELEGLQSRVQKFIRLQINSPRGKTEPLEQEVDLQRCLRTSEGLSYSWNLRGVARRAGGPISTAPEAVWVTRLVPHLWLPGSRRTGNQKKTKKRPQTRCPV
jgi:hypothetical protein